MNTSILFDIPKKNFIINVKYLSKILVNASVPTKKSNVSK